MKVKNVMLKNTLAGISTENVQFDNEGIGEIQSQKIYEDVLKLKNFFPVEEEVVTPPEEPKTEEPKIEEPKVEEVTAPAIEKTPIKKAVTKK